VSNKIDDYVELFHQRGIFIPTKTMRLVGEVDIDMFNNALCNLHSLDSIHGEITIKLMSDGGSVSIARGIYDLIRGCKNKVRIICYGEVSSSGTIILQAGDQRIMSENSKLMIHVGSEGFSRDHPRNIDRLYEQCRIDEAWMEDVYLERIKEKKKRYTRHKIKDLLTWDKSFSPKEALDMGLIDEVGEIQ
jgi:ATP-dependent protease ClpP protease subunit